MGCAAVGTIAELACGMRTDEPRVMKRQRASLPHHMLRKVVADPHRFLELEPALGLELILERVPAKGWKYLLVSLLAFPVALASLGLFNTGGIDANQPASLVAALAALVIGGWSLRRSVQSDTYGHIVFVAASRLLDQLLERADLPPHDLRDEDADLVREAAAILAGQYADVRRANDLIARLELVERHASKASGSRGVARARRTDA